MGIIGLELKTEQAPNNTIVVTVMSNLVLILWQKRTDLPRKNKG